MKLLGIILLITGAFITYFGKMVIAKKIDKNLQGKDREELEELIEKAVFIVKNTGFIICIIGFIIIFFIS